MGPSTVTCDDGKWSELDLVTPKCELRQCPNMSDQVKAGRIECSSKDGHVPIGSSCSLKCEEGMYSYNLKLRNRLIRHFVGYIPVGTPSVECNPDGEYNDIIGRCQRIPMASQFNEPCRDPPFHPDATFAAGPECTRQEVINKKTFKIKFTDACLGQWL